MTQDDFDRVVGRLFLAWLRAHRLARPQYAPRLYERSDMLAAYRAGAAHVAELALSVIADDERPEGAATGAVARS